MKNQALKCEPVEDVQVCDSSDADKMLPVYLPLFGPYNPGHIQLQPAQKATTEGLQFTVAMRVINLGAALFSVIYLYCKMNESNNMIIQIHFKQCLFEILPNESLRISCSHCVRTEHLSINNN